MRQLQPREHRSWSRAADVTVYLAAVGGTLGGSFLLQAGEVVAGPLVWLATLCGCAALKTVSLAGAGIAELLERTPRAPRSGEDTPGPESEPGNPAYPTGPRGPLTPQKPGDPYGRHGGFH